MKAHIRQRLETLRNEFESGQAMLADLEIKQRDTRDTLLRISGAIQVLEEMHEQPAADNAEPAEARLASA